MTQVGKAGVVVLVAMSLSVFAQQSRLAQTEPSLGGDLSDEDLIERLGVGDELGGEVYYNIASRLLSILHSMRR